MLRNYLAAALRHLARSRLYAAISIFGLSLGLCAAILAGVVIRNQMTFDRFIQGYDHTYLVTSVLIPQGRAPDYNLDTHDATANMLKLRFREIEAVTRVALQDVTLGRNGTEVHESIYWADPNFFELLPLPVVTGDLRTALRSSDGIVLTRDAARKYFGRDDPVGQTLLLEHVHPMVVRAVIENLPPNATTLETGIFASGLAAFSKLSQLAADPANAPGAPGFQLSVRTYVRLAPNADPARVDAQMPAVMDNLWSHRPPGLAASMKLLRIDQVHLFEGINPGIHARLKVIGVIAALILLVAAVNFVNLATARSARRAVEVGVRKAAGAGRGALVAQFLGESVLYVALSAVVAIALSEFLLPYLNAFLDAGASFRPWRDPRLLLWIVGSALLLAYLAGLYPAVVLSSFRPAAVLKGEIAHSRVAERLRQVLVIVQFSALVGLMICAGVVYQQRKFATTSALQMNIDQVLLLEAPCNPALVNELHTVPGVHAVSCSGQSLMNGAMFANVQLADGRAQAITLGAVDAGLLDVYGVKLLAGRFFPKEAPAQGGANAPLPPLRFVVNETAVRRLEYGSPGAAIGKVLKMQLGPYHEGEIIGVVSDFSFGSVEKEIAPTAYFVAPPMFDLIHVKLTGADIPQALAAIDNLGRLVPDTHRLNRTFLSDYLENLYRSVLREAQAFGMFSLVAVLLSCLGLIGLAAASADRRTKEIGVRKAMGAETRDIMKLLVWQFTQPVLWGSLIAWPVSAYFMGRWLNGFAYHADLDLRLFVLAAILALGLAVLTVVTQCYLVAGQKPVIALRYE